MELRSYRIALGSQRINIVTAILHLVLICRRSGSVASVLVDSGVLVDIGRGEDKRRSR